MGIEMVIWRLERSFRILTFQFSILNSNDYATNSWFHYSMLPPHLPGRWIVYFYPDRGSIVFTIPTLCDLVFSVKYREKEKFATGCGNSPARWCSRRCGRSSVRCFDDDISGGAVRLLQPVPDAEDATERFTSSGKVDVEDPARDRTDGDKRNARLSVVR